MPIGSGGVLLGRAADSDVVLTDERASRRHALVHVSGDAARLVRLSDGRTELDGTPVAGQRTLDAGQRISVPGLTLSVERGPERESERVEEWVLQRPSGGGLYGVSQTPFRVGGGADDLSIEGWPEGALIFRRVGGNVSVEATVAAVIDGVAMHAGHIEPCASGTRIEIAGEALRVLVASEVGGMASTAQDVSAPPRLPHRVTLAFLPRGARLRVEQGADSALVYLPERRAELVSLLLAPPAPHGPGDVIPDDLVLARLWPRQDKTNNDIHVLVHRLRKSLVGAGLDGARLVAREPRTGGTRFGLAEGAEVRVE